MSKIFNSEIPVFGYIIGPSAVGKEYGVGAVLREYRGANIFVTGDFCRDNASIFASTGALAPDDIIFNAARAHFEKNHSSKYYFIDAPRTIGQMVRFTEMFLLRNANARIVSIHIHAHREHCEARIRDRAIRQNRLDDAKPEVIARRLDTYFNPGGIHDTMVPYAQGNTEYHHVDGNQDLEKVRKHVLTYLVQGVLCADPSLSHSGIPTS